MKKIMAYLFVFVFALIMCGTNQAHGHEKLSELSDEECIAFLQEYEVEIPNEENVSWIKFIRYVIEKVEADPDMEFSFGYTVAADFAQEIKNAVNEYYGNGQSTQNCRLLPTSGLQDNIVYGEWSSDYYNYNCYGYAINFLQLINPGQLTWENSGLSNYQYDWHVGVEIVANWVKLDLESLGYIVDTPTTQLSDAYVSAHDHLICIRVDTDGEMLYGYRDYHLMKLEADNFWYHKPGQTNPLRYNYWPDNNLEWVNESYDGNVAVRVEEFTYDSEIYYIRYTTPHEYEYVHQSNTHTYTCTICGDTPYGTETCDYVYVFSGTVNGINRHHCMCASTGYYKSMDALCFYKNGSNKCMYCGTSKGSILHGIEDMPLVAE